MKYDMNFLAFWLGRRGNLVEGMQREINFMAMYLISKACVGIYKAGGDVGMCVRRIRFSKGED